MDFDELRKANVARCNASFHGLEEWSVTDWACAMAGEAGEVCNAAKKLKRMESIGQVSDGDPATVPEAVRAIGEELADVVIYCDLLAARLGLDLEQEIIWKFNEVSERVHSGITISG